MKANEAPEKLYIALSELTEDGRTFVSDHRVGYPICTEYTRTDAIIEKQGNHDVYKESFNEGYKLGYREASENIAKEPEKYGLQKLGEQKSIDNLTPQEAMDIAVAKCFEQGGIDNVPSEDSTNTIINNPKKPKFKVGDYVKNVNDKREPIYEIVYMDKECYICEYRGKENIGDKAVMHFSFDNPYLRLVQKPADNIEPKFKVGDWVVNNEDGSVGQITKIIHEVDDDGLYAYEHTNGYFHNAFEKDYHLWTIKDTKRGDVLVAENGWTCIFKELEGENFSSFCFMDSGCYFYEGSECHTTDERICGKMYPATNEQRDLLFQKMKEAGYEWNDKKKELKKIEQKPVIIPKFRVGDVVRHIPNEVNMSKAEYRITRIDDKFYYSEWEDGVEFILFGFPVEDTWELVKQGSTDWSEKHKDTTELEMKRHNEGYVKGVHDAYNNINQARSILNQLRKEKPKQEWSEEDERLRKTTIAFLKDFAEQGYENAIECIGWLKSLKYNLL